MIREQMLRGLGWNILRIWSTDWWVDADTVVEKIHAQLNALLEQRRTERALRSNVVPWRAKQEENDVEPAHSPALDPDDSPPVQVLYGKAAPANISSSAEIYIETDFNDTDFSVNPEAFFDEHYASTLISMIEHVVSREAPLRDDVLARRIARAHGWQRTGSRIQDRVNQLARTKYHLAKEGEFTFVWKAPSDLQEIRFRAPAFGESRAVEEVSTPELIALARELFEGGIQQKLDAMSAMASKLGLQRLRTVSRERLASAWDLAVARI
jgi:hypothetical protein